MREPYTELWIRIGLSHRPKRKPNGITKADREAMKSDDLLKRDFRSDTPIRKMYYGYHGDPASNGNCMYLRF